MNKMTFSAVVWALLAGFVLLVAAGTAYAADNAESAGLAAVKKAADANKYVFLFVFDKQDDETNAARQAFEAAASKLGDTVLTAFVDMAVPAEQSFVEKFQLKGAPMPLVLAVASNGAITGGLFGDKLKDPQLKSAMASPAEQQCMKALQDKKFVLVCLQNATTKSNDDAMQGVNDFKADAQFAARTEVVKADPASEQEFIKKLKVDANIAEATTAFIVPPGRILAKMSGATTKDTFTKALEAAASGGSCCPGGGGGKSCCPAK